MHHAHNGPGIDRVLGEIKRDGASKEGSRAEQGRHFDSVLRFVITVQNAKVIVAIAVEERTARWRAMQLPAAGKFILWNGYTKNNRNKLFIPQT